MLAVVVTLAGNRGVEMEDSVFIPSLGHRTDTYVVANDQWTKEKSINLASNDREHC